MKMSQDFEKVLIPGRKVAYRLFGEKGWPLFDLLVRQEEKDDIKAGKRILCRHPFIEQKRVAVVAKKVGSCIHWFLMGMRAVLLLRNLLLRRQNR
mmetsp:Transcript_6763/g.9879  ORF Transcript_6763/g.9879 Transcript_6763/m.9879 type:complete len:95 (-) Transcript_6763:134-418(-)